MLAFSLALLLAFAAPLAAQPAATDTVRYTIGWDNPASQLYHVTVTAAARGEPVVFSLPAWRPGRYIVQNYAANVQSVRARGAGGKTLPARWIDLDSWRVDPGTAGSVTLEFDYYAHTFDAGSSTLTPNVAYFNPVNLLPWVEGRKASPATLALEAPAEWTVATQLAPARGGTHRFTAPNYDRLVDSPTIGSPDLVLWDYDVDDVNYHLAFRPVAGPLELGNYSRQQIIADVSRLTREAVAVIGVAPFPEYWHLFQLVPYPFGHAVEHEASASYVVQDDLFRSAGGYDGFLSIMAHEFFHAWNVKRIRPAAMWPYDYSTPQLTRLNWVTEGITSYYAILLRARAGLLPEPALRASLGSEITSLQDTPGRLVTSAELSSLTAWHSGYGDGNSNKAISFYAKGSALGLLLDLTIRDATDGARGLDDVMRLLWTRYYMQGHGYPEDGFQRAAEEVAGRSLADFFSRYVAGTDELPWDATLRLVGYSATARADAGRPAATFGWRLAAGEGGVSVARLFPDSPALAAGVMRDDLLVSIDGVAVASTNIDSLLARHAAGDQVTVVVRRFGDTMERRVTLAGGGNIEWVVEPDANPTAR
ncbi:MAG TPA: PDZ domain-containing protein, partial [Gemmatimonadaceae bacterium]|nr:PDZ domain-containing protein [Gemmatimonadaceae bacterium]